MALLYWDGVLVEINKDLVLYEFYLLCAVKLSIPVRCNNTKPRLPIPASVKSQLHNNTTPICFVGVNPILAFQPLIDPV